VDEMEVRLAKNAPPYVDRALAGGRFF